MKTLQNKWALISVTFVLPHTVLLWVHAAPISYGGSSSCKSLRTFCLWMPVSTHNSSNAHNLSTSMQWQLLHVTHLSSHSQVILTIVGCWLLHVLTEILLSTSQQFGIILHSFHKLPVAFSDDSPRATSILQCSWITKPLAWKLYIVIV